MRFYLGTHQPNWLWHLTHHWFERDQIPLFVAHQRLEGLRTLPRANTPWALDSGAFSEIAKHGRWTISPADYAANVRRFHDEIGRMDWCAQQDWMCEPEVIKKTGLSVAEHQRRTTENYLELRTIAPDLPWRPTIQGDYRDAWLRHVDAYEAAGIDLAAEPLVGLGSVCRLQNTTPVHRLVEELHAAGLRLHGFGFKTEGLRAVGHLLASADSLAWSLNARYRPAMPECFDWHERCQNCPRYATTWRRRLLSSLPPAAVAA